MRHEDSILMIESFAPETLATHSGTLFQKREVAHIIGDGLSPSVLGGVALNLEFSLSPRAKFPADVERAIPHRSETP